MNLINGRQGAILRETTLDMEQFECVAAAFGGIAYLQTGQAFPDETRPICELVGGLYFGHKERGKDDRGRRSYTSSSMRRPLATRW